MRKKWAVGVDLGGTKTRVALVDDGGEVRDSLRMATGPERGPLAVTSAIVEAVKGLQGRAEVRPIGIGIGMAGQIDGRSGLVRFAPNLGWRDVPLRTDLERLLEMRAVVTNDVRAIVLGEWLYGAGRGCDDIICLYVGTGVGGGVVSDGRLLLGCTNTAGELGHITIDMDGPLCTCGNRGCLEAMAGGWAIARQARQVVVQDQERGRTLLELTGGSVEAITAETVARSAAKGDGLALEILENVGRALTAGCVSLVNAFNPCRLILGGGVIDGVPELIEKVRRGVKQFALPAATSGLELLPGALGADAGVIGAASLAQRTIGEEA